ncbi:hypothetical protein V5799_004205 [Amblyomma americanum]|uniref:Uncharacterized protein n=1 Tax=Amblyomma americanum TaxID=6943 RepID=A0AAQ4D6S3_AMBAM
MPHDHGKSTRFVISPVPYPIRGRSTESTAMTAANCTAILVLLVGLWLNIEGCYNKQRVTFCPRSRFVFENRCPGVSPRRCRYVELVCGCYRGAARTSDGRCVLNDDCERQKKAPDAGGDPNSPKEPEKKAPDAGGDPNSPKEPEKKAPDADGDPNSPKDKPTESVPEPEVPKPPQVEVLPVIKEDVYYSGGQNGCPDNYDQCSTVCVDLGFERGTCDPLLTRYCFCKRLTSTIQPKLPDLSKGRHRVGFPFGQLVSNGDLIWQLTERVLRHIVDQKYDKVKTFRAVLFLVMLTCGDDVH